MNMSSHGILFVEDRPLSIGTKVVAEVDWPVKLNGTVPLKLIVEGSVVRLEARGIALSIQRREFYIRKK